MTPTPKRSGATKKTASSRSAGATRGKPQKNGSLLSHADPHAWVEAQEISDTAELPLPDHLIDEVIGQDEAVAVAKKAARQRRHLLLLGDPGTGKSMIARAMAQILPPTRLDDVLVERNAKDPNLPVVTVLPGGEGRARALQAQKRAQRKGRGMRIFEIVTASLLAGLGIAAYFFFGGGTTAMLLGVICLMAALFFVFVMRQIAGRPSQEVPNLLIERPSEAVPAPYVDATGSHHGALMGDVRHDPYQSGGLETPTHLRVEPGSIHRAHKGLLFIDEINVLRLDSQQALLTAMQEKKYAITGQSERSAGAMVRTAPVPCDFILVAAGNLDVLDPIRNGGGHTGLHPALRSRIRGYGYEVFVRSVMEDTDENRHKLVRFIAQEVRRDGQIPHFTGPAVAEVLREAQRRSAHSGKLTLRLRELGGLVRTAGDIARDEGAERVTVEHVLDAKRMSMSLEYQVTRRDIEVTTAREATQVEGKAVGIATGCAVVGTGETGEPAGIVVPIEADATVSSHKQRGSIYIGGGLQDSGLGENLSAILKRLRGVGMADTDLHVQALLAQQADVGALGASAAVAALSALEAAPVRRDTVFIGALGVSGRLRAVDGITQMLEAAADLGYARAVVPRANHDDILLEHGYRDRIEIVLADDLWDAVEAAVSLKAPRRKALAEAFGR